MSRYYDEDPSDPDAPYAVEEFNGLRPGMHVVYRNPAWQQPDGTYRTGGMDPPLVIDELVLFPMHDGPWVEAILNDGEWQCSALNLAPDPDA